MEFTGLEQMVVLNNHVLRRNNQLLTNRELQLRPQPQPQLPQNENGEEIIDLGQPVATARPPYNPQYPQYPQYQEVNQIKEHELNFIWSIFELTV